MSTLPAIEPGPATGHPRGLYVLFGAEMWERFSYYGMRSLLTLYLTKHLKMSDDDAGLIYGSYTGMVYVTPIFGGYLADRYLGQRKAILVGGLVMAMGHFAMAFEEHLYLALCLLILGNGFFKPNISTMVGNLYTKDDTRRDGAYTIFYMGINTGAFLAPIVCGKLGEDVGWHYGFGAAGIGMLLGVLTFAGFQRLLAGGFPPGRAEGSRLGAIDYAQVVGLAAVCLGLAYAGLQIWPGLRPIWRPAGWGDRANLAYHATAAALVFAAIFYLGSRRGKADPALEGVEPERSGFTAIEWQRLGVIAIASAFAVIFWAGFEQAGSTLTLFADRKTDRTLYGALGKPFPTAFFQTVNAGSIIALAPVFSLIWSRLERSGRHVPSTAKIGFGLLWVGLGYVLMYLADRQFAATGTRVGAQWLATTYVLHTIGELCLSPIGLSLVNRLAPARVASLMMAVWFLAPAFGNYLAGTLDSILKGFGINLWVFSSVIPIGSGILMLSLTPVLRRMAHGRD